MSGGIIDTSPENLKRWRIIKRSLLIGGLIGMGYGIYAWCAHGAMGTGITLIILGVVAIGAFLAISLLSGM